MAEIEPITADPIFAALAAAEAATRALAALGEALTKAPYLNDLEVAEALAGRALTEAEFIVLSTRPTTIEGSAALARWLTIYLREQDKGDPVAEALDGIGAALMAFTSAVP